MSQPGSPVPPREAGHPAGGTYSDVAVQEIYARLLGACLAAGLSRPESEDVAQDVWLWLLSCNSPPVALAVPWLSAVVRNFVLRYRRRAGRRRGREGVPLEAVPEPGSPFDTSTLEANEVLDRISSLLPETERKILVLIRKGYTLAKAVEILGIPRGSRAYYGGRLVRLAREGIRRRIPPAGH